MASVFVGCCLAAWLWLSLLEGHASASSSSSFSSSSSSLSSSSTSSSSSLLSSTSAGVEDLLRGWLREAESDVHAVLVSTSRSWQNYRHMANALTVYSLLKQQGLSDSHIVLMLAGVDGPCSPRSVFPGGVYRSNCRRHNLFGGHDACAREVELLLTERNKEATEGSRLFSLCAAGARPWEGAEIDARGDNVTVQKLTSILTGRVEPDTPWHQRLHSGPQSSLLVFLTGHGGDEFFKFSDWEALHAEQLAEVIWEMHEMRRFKRMLIIAETCQAATMLHKIQVPGVLRVSSSLKDESSYSFVGDREVGASLVDRWTYSTAAFLNSKANADAQGTLARGDQRRKNGKGEEDLRLSGAGRLQSPVSELIASFDSNFLMANVGAEEKAPLIGKETLKSLPLSAFFSRRVQLTSLPIRPALSIELQRDRIARKEERKETNNEAEKTQLWSYELFLLDSNSPAEPASESSLLASFDSLQETPTLFKFPFSSLALAAAISGVLASVLA